MSLISKSTIKAALIALTITTTVASCSTSKDKESANKLLTDAEQLFNNSEYDSTIILLDSLKSSYPRELEIQRQGIYLRTITNEQLILAEIIENDSTIELHTKAKQELDNLFSFIKTKDMVEGYQVIKTAKPQINRTGIDTRIDEQGNIYIVSLVHGNSLKHTFLVVSSEDGTEASTDTIAYNGSTNYRFNDNGTNNEMVTFRHQQCDSLCRYIKDNSNKNLKLTFKGDNQHTITLTKADKDIIINSYNYSQAIINGRNALAKEIYLNKKLQIAESQIAKAKELTKPDKN